MKSSFRTRIAAVLASAFVTWGLFAGVVSLSAEPDGVQGAVVASAS